MTRKTITPKQVFARYCAIGAVVSVFVVLAVFVPSPGTIVLACLATPTLIVWNSVLSASRRAFTEAVKNMKPISRAKDDTLFPEEIDPEKAETSYVDVTHHIMNQCFVCIAISLLACVVVFAMVETVRGRPW